MQISRNKFEAFFLDYWEGNLSDKEKEALSRFLENNPDLQDVFYEYQEVKDFRLIANEKIAFEGKNRLKKEEVTAFGNIDNDNYENWVIALLEGDLTKKEQNDFKQFISLNPHIEKVITDYKMVYLKPPKNLIFQNKEQLKRKTIFLVQPRFSRWLGAAAAILIVGITMFYFFLSNPPVDLSNQLAQKTQPSMNEKENTISLEGAAKTTKIDNSRSKKNEETNQTGDFAKRGSNKVSPLTAIAPVTSLADKITPPRNVENRGECSLIFDDLLLRDALKANSEKTEVRKSAVERIFANLGSKIINSKYSDSENKSLVSQIATKGKGTVTGFSSILPVYRTSKNDDKKETYLAFTDNFSIYRCKTIDEIKPEKNPTRH